MNKFGLGDENDRRLYKTSSSGTDIGDTDSLLLSQRLFDCNIPLERVGRFEIRINCIKRPNVAGVGRHDWRRRCIVQDSKETWQCRQ